MQAMIERWIQLQSNQTAELEQFFQRSREQVEVAPHQKEEKPATARRLPVEVVQEDSGMPSAPVINSENGGVEHDSVVDSGSMAQEVGGESLEAQKLD